MIFDISVSISIREYNKEFTPSNAVEDNHGRGRTKNICGHLGHSYFYQLSFASVSERSFFMEVTFFCIVCETLLVDVRQLYPDKIFSPYYCYSLWALTNTFVGYFDLFLPIMGWVPFCLFPNLAEFSFKIIKDPPQRQKDKIIFSSSEISCNTLFHVIVCFTLE